jgi:hypothetical protein
MSIVDRYKQLVKSPIREEIIKTHIPTPSDSDYSRGFIRRCFVQKTNDKGSPIFEISQSNIGKYKANPLYTAVELKWRISGPTETKYNNIGNITDKSVSESNRIAIKLVSDLIPNLKLYLPNLLQFYK